MLPQHTLLVKPLTPFASPQSQRLWSLLNTRSRRNTKQQKKKKKQNKTQPFGMNYWISCIFFEKLEFYFIFYSGFVFSILP